MPALSLAQRTAAYRKRRYGRRYRLPSGGIEKTVTFGSGTPLGVRVWIALGADVTASWLTWSWMEITQYVRWDPGISTSQGRRDQDDTVAPSWMRATLSNPDGIFARLNPTSPLYGLLTRFTPVRAEVDPGTGFVHRYMGFINDWPKRWRDKSANDPVVHITAHGPMHRLLRQQPLPSTLRRSLTSSGEVGYLPHAYWPLEDGPDTTQFASGFAGGPALTPGGINFVGATPGTVSPAEDDTLQGSAALPVFNAASSVSGTIPTYVDTDRWVWQQEVMIPTALDGLTGMALLTLETNHSSYPFIVIGLNTSAYQLQTAIYDSSEALFAEWSPFFDGDTMLDQWLTLTVISTKDGSGSNDTITTALHDLDGNTVLSDTQTVAADFHSTLASFILRAPHGSIGGASYGHATLFTSTAFSVTNDINRHARAAGGYRGDMAHERIRRLCLEEGLPFQCGAQTSALVGPQPAGNLLAVCRDAAKADLGILYEYEFGLGYLALSERYNQTQTLELDVAQGQVADDLEPADDDLRYHNQWTTHRTNGSEYTAEPEGGLAVTELAYPASDTFNVETDGQLEGLAQWLVHRDTIDEDYWPSVGINLAAHPELITSWLALPFNARVQVANVMEEAGVASIDAIREGWTEQWNSLQWAAQLNTTPASPYSVLRLDDDDLGKLDSGSSSLTSALDSSATSFDVTTTDSRDLWTTDTAELPITLVVGGEHIRIPASGGSIVGASSPQTFSGAERSINGVIKSHSAGTEVHVLNPARLAQ